MSHLAINVCCMIPLRYASSPTPDLRLATDNLYASAALTVVRHRHPFLSSLSFLCAFSLIRNRDLFYSTAYIPVNAPCLHLGSLVLVGHYFVWHIRVLSEAYG